MIELHGDLARIALPLSVSNSALIVTASRCYLWTHAGCNLHAPVSVVVLPLNLAALRLCWFVAVRLCWLFGSVALLVLALLFVTCVLVTYRGQHDLYPGVDCGSNEC